MTGQLELNFSPIKKDKPHAGIVHVDWGIGKETKYSVILQMLAWQGKECFRTTEEIDFGDDRPAAFSYLNENIPRM